MSKLLFVIPLRHMVGEMRESCYVDPLQAEFAFQFSPMPGISEWMPLGLISFGVRL